MIKDNFANILNNNLNIRKWNDAMALKYNPDLYHNKSFFIIRLIEKIRVCEVLNLLATSDEDKILDIGCGAGNIIEHFKKGKLFGIDLSKDLLMIASQKKYKVPLSLIQCFGEKLPFKSHIFDKVYCSEVIEHIKEPYSVIEEAYRVLNTDGFFVLSIPNEKFINFVKMILRWFYIDKLINSISTYKFAIDMIGEWHIHTFNFKSTKELFGNLFVIEKVRYVPFRIFPLQIVFICKKKT